MTAQEQAIANDASCIYTNSTALAAALVSLGFQLKPARSIVRTFTQSRPQGTLGVFFFRLEPASSTWHISDPDQLRRQWITRDIEAEFDRLKAEIAETASRGVLAAANGQDAKGSLEIVQQKFARFLEILPAAILAYQSQAEENHTLLKNKMKQIVRDNSDGPMRRIDHPGKQTYTIVPANMPDDQVAALLSHAL